MIDAIIPLLSSFVNSGILPYVLLPMFGLFFLATVPVIVRSFFNLKFWR